MLSLSSSSSFHLTLLPPWKYHTNKLFNNTKLYTKSPRNPVVNSSSKEDSHSSSPKQKKQQVGFDHSDELFGLDVDIPSRDAKPDNPEPRSWFGPNGQYIKELPCPSCRGRGYTPCAECGIERSRKDCSLCHGKGIMTCQRCLGECVIWEESIDEKPWEKARSISPLKVKEDDDVDNLDLQLDVRKKSKRVYRSTPPEVGQKISRSLKSLNAKTGLFSKRMKIIHQDPALHAQRVAAVKKAKRTTAARKRASEALKMYFSNPENRLKRSIALTGKKYICKKCGHEGHRSYYCPKQQEIVDRRSRCSLCGERGHSRVTCQKTPATKPMQRVLRQYNCRACGQVGHNRRTCSLKAELESVGALTGNETSHTEDSTGQVQKHYHCGVCGHSGHNRRTCPQQTVRHVDVKAERGPRRSHHCRRCGIVGHNRRTCSEATLTK